MTTHHDTIIIGAGHNGLVAAAYLAKQGKKVLVLERRAIVGGSVVTESFGDNFSVDSLHTGGTLRPDIIKDLKLASHGLQPFGSAQGKPDSASERLFSPFRFTPLRRDRDGKLIAFLQR